jgi:hypothetical protein
MDPQGSGSSALSLVYGYAELDLGEVIRSVIYAERNLIVEVIVGVIFRFHRRNNLKMDPLMVRRFN